MTASKIYTDWFSYSGEKEISYKHHLERISFNANSKRFVIKIKSNGIDPIIYAFLFVPFKIKIFKL